MSDKPNAVNLAELGKKIQMTISELNSLHHNFLGNKSYQKTVGEIEHNGRAFFPTLSALISQAEKLNTLGSKEQPRTSPKPK